MVSLSVLRRTVLNRGSYANDDLTVCCTRSVLTPSSASYSLNETNDDIESVSNRTDSRIVRRLGTTRGTPRPFLRQGSFRLRAILRCS
jgi:hypothetical protein